MNTLSLDKRETISTHLSHVCERVAHTPSRKVCRDKYVREGSSDTLSHVMLEDDSHTLPQALREGSMKTRGIATLS